MAELWEVLEFLAPNTRIYGTGNTYEDIVWLDGAPSFSKQEFLDAFAEVDRIKEEKKAAVEAKLMALGLTVEDIRTALEK